MDDTQIAVHCLRINVKSLASEARHIRTEVKRAKDSRCTQRLHQHRTNRLKPEARLAHLALAYCKGVPYKRVEPSTKRSVASAELRAKLARFLYVTPDAVEAWLNAA